MMKKLYIIFLFVFLLNIIGCETKTVVTEPAASTEPVVGIEPVVEQVKATIPLDERKFIYNNGINIEQKEFNTLDENNIKITNMYPIISGLKDKSVQNKINNDIQAVCNKLLSEYVPRYIKLRQADIIKVNSKSSNAYISYSFNNVIFVEFNAYIDAKFKDNIYYPSYTNVSYGYDLNTGENVSLDDIFKPGSDYKSKINSFISQYIIDNNYDDYEAERMTKPFQGIRENQSFAMSFEGLRIILDEKNDEFFNNGYSDQIFIPLKYFGDDLYIFDKYFDESNNIYDRAKLSKKLLPNKLEYKVNNIIQEDNPKYYIYITQGEFINVPNKDMEKKLNDMIASKFDLQGFKDKAKRVNNAKGNSQYFHSINLFANAGGYISMAVTEDIRFGSAYEIKRVPFNYDFNQNREMLLSDIFKDEVDISHVIKTYIKTFMNLNLSEDILEAGVKEGIKSNKFNFDEYSIQIYFDPKGANLDNYQKWVYIPFEEFGMENIKLFN